MLTFTESQQNSAEYPNTHIYMNMFQPRSNAEKNVQGKTMALPEMILDTGVQVEHDISRKPIYYNELKRTKQTWLVNDLKHKIIKYYIIRT